MEQTGAQTVRHTGTISTGGAAIQTWAWATRGAALTIPSVVSSAAAKKATAKG